MHYRRALTAAYDIHANDFIDHAITKNSIVKDKANHEIELEILREPAASKFVIHPSTHIMLPQSDGAFGAKSSIAGKVTVSQQLLDKFGEDEEALKAYFLRGIKQNIVPLANIIAAVAATVTAAIAYFACKAANSSEGSKLTITIASCLISFAIVKAKISESWLTSQDSFTARKISPEAAIKSLEIERDYAIELNPESKHTTTLSFNRRIDYVRSITPAVAA